jgi:hypothetical protein
MMRFTPLCLLFLALCLPAQAAPPPASAKPLTLASDGFTLRIDPARAWSLDQIQFHGKEVGQPNGNYGLVWSPASANYIGGSHTQGGREEVLDLSLTVDGQPVDLSKTSDVTVQKEAEFIKESRMGDLLVRSTTRFTPDRIEFQRNVTVEKDVHVHIMFPFMFCWKPETDQWLARADTGQLLEGKLQSNKDWELQKNVRWTAIYDPKAQIAMLTELPPDMNGVGRKNAYWDLPAYHKQYFQSISDRDLKKGQTLQYRLTLRGFQAVPDQWKELVKSQAFELEGESSLPLSTATAPTTQSALQKQVEHLYPPLDKTETPDWLAHPVAMAALDPDTVLQPWTPVEADIHSVSVWNRRYELGEGALPKQITAADEPLLTAPVRLDIQLQGQSAPVQLSAPKITETHKGQVQYASGSAGDQTSVQLKSTYEYDGFSRFDLTIQAPEDLKVDHLELVIPIRSSHAILYNNAAPWHFGQSQAIYAQAGALPTGDGEIYASEFKPYFWIGDHMRGLSWFSESDQWIRPAKNDRVVRIVRKGDTVELHIVYVDRAVALPPRINLSFGLMATPVKPLPKAWRNWRFSSPKAATFQPQPPPAINQVIYWADAFRIIYQYPRPRDPAAFKQDVATLHEEGAQRVYPYLDVTLLGTQSTTTVPGEHFTFATPEWAAFGEQWANVPNYKPGRPWQRVSPASHWADFSLWVVKQWILNGGADGVYTDEAFPYADTSAAHGCGYTDTDGVRQPTWPIFATRDYFKRLAYLFQKHAKGSPAIIAHTSSTIAVPYLSFADIALDGEQFYHTIKKYTGTEDPSYLALVPLDRYQAELMTQQVGLVPAFLPEFRNDITDKRFPGIRRRTHPTREFLAQTLLHDMLVWPLWCNADEVNATYGVLARFNTGAADVAFHPYWEKLNQAAVQGEGIKLSYYQRPGQILGIVVNTANHAQTVTLDLAQLKKGDWEFTNARTGQSVKNQLEIPARDFRIILATTSDK